MEIELWIGIILAGLLIYCVVWFLSRPEKTEKQLFCPRCKTETLFEITTSGNAFGTDQKHKPKCTNCKGSWNDDTMIV